MARERMQPLTFNDLSDDIQLLIMFMVAISSRRNCRLVLQLSKRFKDIPKLSGFYNKIQFTDVPRTDWRTPSSYQQEFIYKCREAMNPENFWKYLVIDIFQYKNFGRVDEFLPLLKGHPHQPYCECVIQLLSPHKHHQEDGERRLVAIRSTKEGLKNLMAWRVDLCQIIQDLTGGYLWQHHEKPKLYCIEHPVPNWFEKHNITCKGCMANFELQFYYDPGYLAIVQVTRP